jgi:hypothetical protein
MFVGERINTLQPHLKEQRMPYQQPPPRIPDQLSNIQFAQLKQKLRLPEKEIVKLAVSELWASVFEK